MDKKTLRNEWHPVYFNQLPRTEAKADAKISYAINGYTCNRGITIMPLGHNTYAGDIMRGNAVTGTWRWNMSFKDPHVTSYLRVNGLGQHKRYSHGHAACQAIKTAILEYREEHASGGWSQNAAA